jgi:hypothetical protein
MAGKDKQHREAKKPKKGAKKESISTIIPSSPDIEVVKKGKKTKEEEF